MIAGMFARYLAFLRLPDVTRVLAFTFIARLPMGMVTLSLLMHVRALTGSFSVAGTTVGCFMAASAITAPFVGRWIDRAGPRIPLLVTGVCSPAAMLVIFFAHNFGLAPGGLYIVALLAGCFAPPITVLVRTILRQRFEGDQERKLAFTVDAIMVEGVFTLGPLLTAAALTFGSPRAAFGVAVCLAALSVPMFMASHATRYFRGEVDAERSLLGPLTEPSLLAVYATTFLLTMTFGFMEVGYPAFGATHAWAALGAMLIALNSVGSAMGGFIYGGLHVATESGRLLPRLLLAMVLPLALHAMTTSIVAYAVLAVIAGLLVAPALTVVMLLVSERAPARYAAEAFTWSATCIVSGFALGAAAAGRIVDAYSPQMAFAAAACTIAAAALVSVVTRPRTPVNLPAPT